MLLNAPQSSDQSVLIESMTDIKDALDDLSFEETKPLFTGYSGNNTAFNYLVKRYEHNYGSDNDSSDYGPSSIYLPEPLMFLDDSGIKHNCLTEDSYSTRSPFNLPFNEDLLRMVSVSTQLPLQH